VKKGLMIISKALGKIAPPKNLPKPYKRPVSSLRNFTMKQIQGNENTPRKKRGDKTIKLERMILFLSMQLLLLA